MSRKKREVDRITGVEVSIKTASYQITRRFLAAKFTVFKEF
jgi:hypothetical protein